MILPVARLVPGALVLALNACTCCREWLVPDRQNRSQVAGQSRAAQRLPSHPLTWDEFVAAQQARGLPIADIQKRFKVADADHDNLLTADEIQRHRRIAARNKKERESRAVPTARRAVEAID